MPFALAPQVALAAIQGLLKYRERLDTILSLARAADPLPFRLPDAGYEYGPAVDPMIEFFANSDEGPSILELRGLRQKFAAFQQDSGRLQDRNDLVRAYWEANGLPPQPLGPGEGEAERLERQAKLGVADDQDRRLRLAYFVVESHRLSRNSTVTRVLLAAAQTILEVAGANAEWFISDKRTAAFVETLIQEFVGDGFEADDAPAAKIFKRVLGAAAAAAVEHRADLPDHPALKVLLEALADVKEAKGEDFVAGLVSRDGFERLVGRMLVRAADTPGLLPDQPVLREALAAMLREAGESFGNLLRDPRLLTGVVEAGIAAAIDPALEILDRKLGNQPLLAVVLKAVAGEIKTGAGNSQLFSKIANGEFVAAVYGAALKAVAANPKLIEAAGVSAFAAKLVAGLAGELATVQPKTVFSLETLRSLAIKGIETLAESPDVLGVKNEFAAKILGATLGALASAAKDGLSRADLLEIVEVTLRTVAANLELVKMDERLRAVLTAAAGVLSDQGLKKLADAKARKTAFFAVLEAVAANPVIWKGFAEAELVQPLVQAVLHGFATDPSGLLSGPALVPALRQVLLAAARRGQPVLEGSAKPEWLEALLGAALAKAKDALGRGIDGENLPGFLARVVAEFLQAPFEPAGAQLAALLDQALGALATTALLTPVPAVTRSRAVAAVGTRSARPGAAATRSAPPVREARRAPTRGKPTKAASSGSRPRPRSQSRRSR